MTRLYSPGKRLASVFFAFAVQKKFRNCYRLVAIFGLLKLL